MSSPSSHNLGPEPDCGAIDPDSLESVSLPPKLAAELAKLAASDIPIPPAIDQSIREAAVAHLTHRRRRRTLARVAPWAAAAAVLLLLFLPLWLQTRTSPSGKLAASPPRGAAGMAEPSLSDLHPVDILPAFALERQLDHGGHPSARWDVNGDGVVDQRDVDALAYQATLVSAPAPRSQTAPDDEPSPESPASPGASAPHFAAISVHIDPQGHPLAAYQLHFSARRGHIKVVGIENGDAPAFADRPPYYDRKAVTSGGSDRVIVACFNAKPGAELPTSGTRVTTIHVIIEGSTEPEYLVHLDTAADADGQRIDAVVSLSQGNQP